MNLAEEIYRLRKLVNWTQGELANETGFSIRSINSWETGKIEPKLRSFKEIERVCLLEQAKRANSATHTQGRKPSDATQRTLPTTDNQPHRSGDNPAIGDIEKGSVEVGVYAFAGAGGPIELFEYDPIQTIDIPKHWLKPNMQSVLIRGRSMEPTIRDGAVVGVDTDSKQVVSGELYAIWLEYEGAVVKRLYIERDLVRVCSDNPAFKEMQITHDDINGDTFILGKMCWLMQSY